MAHLRNKAEAPNKWTQVRTRISKQTKAQLEEEMKKALRESEVLEQKTDAELQWKVFKMVVYNTAEKVCEKQKRKHQG